MPEPPPVISTLRSTTLIAPSPHFARRPVPTPPRRVRDVIEIGSSSRERAGRNSRASKAPASATAPGATMYSNAWTNAIALTFIPCPDEPPTSPAIGERRGQRVSLLGGWRAAGKGPLTASRNLPLSPTPATPPSTATPSLPTDLARRAAFHRRPHTRLLLRKVSRTTRGRRGGAPQAESHEHHRRRDDLSLRRSWSRR